MENERATFVVARNSANVDQRHAGKMVIYKKEAPLFRAGHLNSKSRGIASITS
jgi:hypothetical protein